MDREEKDERTNPTSYYDYPNPAAEAVTLYPHPGAPGHGSLRSTPVSESVMESLVDNYSFDGESLARAGGRSIGFLT